MRKPDTAVMAATRHSPRADSRGKQSVELVCLALVLALFVLAGRIASIW